MRLSRNDIPTRIDVPGAVARQQPDFGSAPADATFGAEWFSLGAGTDIAPLLHGLEDDACQAPHWGYVTAGRLVVSYTDGSEETCVGHDLFYWPPGHSVRVEEDAEIILFSPQDAHGAVMDHMVDQMAG